MSYIVIILVLLLLQSCSDRSAKTLGRPDMESSHFKADQSRTTNDTTDDIKAIPFYLTDTTENNGSFVKLTLTSHNADYAIEWGNEYHTWSGDLMTMTNQQGYKMPPAVLWSNTDYICMMTNWTGPFSQHLFLPLKEGRDCKFFKEDVEYIDTVDNFVAYIDDIDTTEPYTLTWNVESLLTEKSRSFTMVRGDKGNLYPWYSDIDRQGDYLLISSECFPTGVRRVYIGDLIHGDL